VHRVLRRRRDGVGVEQAQELSAQARRMSLYGNLIPPCRRDARSSPDPRRALPGGVIPIYRVCAYDRRKVFCVRRTDVTLEVDGSFYFNQDGLVVRATIRVGFGFRMPPRWSLSVPALRNGLRRNRSPLTPGGWASVMARPLRRSAENFCTRQKGALHVFSQSPGGRPGAAAQTPRPPDQWGSVRCRRRSWPRPRQAHCRCERRHDRSQHAGRIRRVRLVAIPQRHPSVVGRILASHASSAVRAAHDREHLAITGDLDVRYRALQYVSTLQHPQRLMISDRHQRIVAHRSRLMSSVMGSS
jgi:hypothetical protein